MENGNRPVRQLRDLQLLFRQMLEQEFANRYGDAIDAGIITPAEARDECQRYYDKYKSGLQNIYSYYTEQWEHFYALRETPDEDFRTRLSTLTSELEKRYGSFVFNAGYYLKELNRISPETAAWRRLRAFFLDRWCRALSDREYNYQLKHIERLCDDFTRQLESSVGSFSEQRILNEEMDARITWVKRRLDPKLKQKITELAFIIKRNPIVRELADILGRKRSMAERKYKAISSRNELHKIHRASRTDIQGVTAGNDLNHLLPLEYGMLATPHLEDIFLQKYSGKQLQMFDSRSVHTLHVKKGQEGRGELSVPDEHGPVVICVDTSGSMAGAYEQVAKAIILSLVLLSEKENRPCRIIMFSSEIYVTEVRTLAQAFEHLSRFFCNTFHGGTDFGPVIAEAVKALHSSDYSEADLLLLSDFDAESLPASLHLQLEDIKERGVEVYSVAFGHRVNSFYTDIADKNWHYQ